MSDSWGRPWSNSSYAPQIPYFLYREEKTFFAGVSTGAIFYGIVVSLFFRCIGALLRPVNQARHDIKWTLVAHTTIMFSLVTIYTAINLHMQSISFIDNREFPGNDVLFPGPIGYQFFLLDKPISIILTVASGVNNLLADALLLHRCYVIYSMNRWAIVFPGFMWVASLVIGVVFVYRTSQTPDHLSIYTDLFNFGISYYTVTVALNVLLTLMIVGRLVVHTRHVRNVMGHPVNAQGPYTSIIVMLTESCALYTVAFLLYVGLKAAGNPVSNAFFPILVQIQTIAPFLITLRVANQRTSKNNTTMPGRTSSIRFRDYRKSTAGSEILPNGFRMGKRESLVETVVESGVAVETTIHLHHDD